MSQVVKKQGNNIFRLVVERTNLNVEVIALNAKIEQEMCDMALSQPVLQKWWDYAELLMRGLPVADKLVFLSALAHCLNTQFDCDHERLDTEVPEVTYANYYKNHERVPTRVFVFRFPPHLLPASGSLGVSQRVRRRKRNRQMPILEEGEVERSKKSRGNDDVDMKE